MAPKEAVRLFGSRTWWSHGFKLLQACFGSEPYFRSKIYRLMDFK